MKVTGQGCGKQAGARIEVERQLAGLAGGDDLHQFVGEVTVGLKETTGADSVGGALGFITQMRSADGDEDFLGACLPVAGIRFAEGDDSGNLGEGGAEVLRPCAHGGAASLAGAADAQQELRVVGVGEELDFADALGDFACAAALPQGGDAAVDQWRTDGTLFDREKIVGRQLEISGRERGGDSHLKAGAVAIVPRRGGMDLDVEWQIQLRGATQALARAVVLSYKYG